MRNRSTVLFPFSKEYGVTQQFWWAAASIFWDNATSTVFGCY